jgi:hypothetical protein
LGLNITESSSSFTPDIADTEPEIADTETATFAPDFVSFDTLENGVLTQLSDNICLEDGILTQFYGSGVPIEQEHDSLDSFSVLLSQGVTIFLTILIAKTKARAKDLTQEKERDPKEMYLLRFNRMKTFLAAHMIAVCDLFIFPPICWQIPMKEIQMKSETSKAIVLKICMISFKFFSLAAVIHYYLHVVG